MPNLFGAKVRYLRSQLGVSQSELARQLGLEGHTHLNHLEARRRIPSLALVLRAATALAVTTDYLLRDELPVDPAHLSETSVRQLDTPLQLFGRKLRMLRTARGLTQVDMMQRLGLASQGYVSKLEAGVKEPAPALVVQIAVLFDVSTEWLLRDDLPAAVIEAERYAGGVPQDVPTPAGASDA
jgi:transcriptional regulator with XRE-family HTH domain